MFKRIIFLILCLLCIIDNCLTEYLLKWPVYAEGNPVATWAMRVSCGIWILKTIILSAMFIFLDKISTKILCISTLGIFLVVVWNAYLFYVAAA